MSSVGFSNLTKTILQHSASCLKTQLRRNANLSAASHARRSYHTDIRPTYTDFTPQMNFIDPSSQRPVSCYQILDNSGRLLVDAKAHLSVECQALLDSPRRPEDTDVHIVSIYKLMLTLSQMDKIMYESQRQGRISFYMTNYGEEATHMGSAAALRPTDLIYGQYREAGVLMYRGFALDQFMNQLYGNELDLGKGKQMPVHYGSKEINFCTISSPLGTQIPQAAGSAYGFKLQGDKNRIAICYFGEGTASEGDAHAAFNFAATLSCPVIFFCRNNGYAISTPANEQYRGDGIVTRAAGYGMPAIRVDGNDIFAVFEATLAARKLCLEKSCPVLIEAMTYRVGHHSTSDDSSAYRQKSEVDLWDTQFSPLDRLRLFLESRDLWSTDDESAFKADVKQKILTAFNAAEKRLLPPLDDMFNDVYAELTEELRRQREELYIHLGNVPADSYPVHLHRRP